MREFTKSVFSYSLAVSLFSLKQMQNLFAPGELRTHALDSLTNATTAELGENLNSLFRTLDDLQRGFVGLTFGFFMPFSSSKKSGDAAAETSQQGVQSSAEPVRWVEVMPDRQQPVSDQASPACTPLR